MKKVVCIFFTVAMLFAFFSVNVYAQSFSVSRSMLFTVEGESGEPDSTAGETPPAGDDIAPEATTPPLAPVVTYTDVPVSTYVDVLITTGDGAVLSDGSKILYRTNDSDWYEYTGELAIDYNCTFFAKTVDANGLESAITTVEITCIDKIPPTPPEILADTMTWVNDFVEVSLVSGTDAESGIAKLEYCLGENGTWTEYSAPLLINAPVVLYARSFDIAGNNSTMASLEINNFDFTAPDVSLMNVAFTSDVSPILNDGGIFGQYFRSDVTVAISGASDSQSGVASYQYQLAGSDKPLSDDGWKPYDNNNRPVISGNFCGYVCVRAIDNTGNISAVFNSANIVVDLEAPVIGKIKFSTTEITDNRVIVTFDITDNIWLDSVMVGNNYLGTYDPTFTVFRNGNYTVTAVDKAGNSTSIDFSVKNINSTPFSMLSVFEQLDENSFTPSTWVNAAAAADELQRLLTVETNAELVSSATEKLVSSMEALVARGDGTMSLELIDRVLEYDKTKYTTSSWLRVEVGIADIKLCLDDPESTQADVDAKRHALELAVSELDLLGNFSSLDRLIKQGEKLKADDYDPVKFQAFTTTLEAAKALPRDDSTQADVDAAYVALLSAMESMKVTEVEKEPSIPLVGYVIIGLLIIFTLTVLFIILKSSSSTKIAASDTGDDGEYDVHPNIGDICFSDDEDTPEI